MRAFTSIEQVFTCDWWYNVNCASSEGLYDLNDNLYKVRMSNGFFINIDFRTSPVCLLSRKEAVEMILI